MRSVQVECVTAYNVFGARFFFYGCSCRTDNRRHAVSNLVLDTCHFTHALRTKKKQIFKRIYTHEHGSTATNTRLDFEVADGEIVSVSEQENGDASSKSDQVQYIHFRAKHPGEGRNPSRLLSPNNGLNISADWAL